MKRIAVLLLATTLELSRGSYAVPGVVYDDDKAEARNAGPAAVLTVE